MNNENTQYIAYIQKHNSNMNSNNSKKKKKK